MWWIKGGTPSARISCRMLALQTVGICGEQACCSMVDIYQEKGATLYQRHLCSPHTLPSRESLVLIRVTFRCDSVLVGCALR